jgi:hypothetical protein
MICSSAETAPLLGLESSGNYARMMLAQLSGLSPNPHAQGVVHSGAGSLSPKHQSLLALQRFERFTFPKPTLTTLIMTPEASLSGSSGMIRILHDSIQYFLLTLFARPIAPSATTPIVIPAFQDGVRVNAGG